MSENYKDLTKWWSTVFVHLSSLLNLSRHTRVKIVLWTAVLIKHVNVEPKNHEIMKMCLGRPERNQFFTLESSAQVRVGCAYKFDEGPPRGPEPLERRTIDQAMPYFRTIHSL